MRSLVIGAGGFVGGHLVNHLLSQGDEVVASSMVATPLVPGVESIPLDITDSVAVADVLRRLQPSVGTANIARHCQLLETKPILVFVSSAEVYGQVRPQELPVTEENALRPANNYSLSKRMAELVVERYGRQGLRHSIVRPFNHIGPGQDSRFVASNFALQLARVARGLTPSVLEVGNLEARRDFSDVRDIVRAYRRVALGDQGVYNLGSGRSYSIQELLDTLIEISGIKVEIRQDPQRMRGPEVPELYGSIERASRVCGWKPEIPLRRSLEDTYRYWYDLVAK